MIKLAAWPAVTAGPVLPVTVSTKLAISSCRLCCGATGAAAAATGGTPAWLPAAMVGQTLGSCWIEGSTAVAAGTLLPAAAAAAACRDYAAAAVGVG